MKTAVGLFDEDRYKEYQAECACGWKGRWFDYDVAAVRELRKHTESGEHLSDRVEFDD